MLYIPDICQLLADHVSTPGGASIGRVVLKVVACQFLRATMCQCLEQPNKVVSRAFLSNCHMSPLEKPKQVDF